MTTIGPKLAVALRPTLPDLAEDIITAIGREVPDYRRPMEGPFGRGVRIGVEVALQRFLEGAAEVDAGGTYTALGRGEARAGRSLAALLNAYRVGARIAWERFSAAGQAAGIEPDELFVLAGAIFTYIDRISAESVEGWTAEATAAQAERGRRRRALVRLLARDDVAPDEVRDLALLAAWPRPATVAALVLADPAADRWASRLGPDVIGVADDDGSLLFVPDPAAPGRRGQLETAVGDVPAALGPEVPLESSARSASRARALLALVTEGVVGGGRLAHADEHLVDLVVHGDAALVADLAAQALAPLDGLRPGSRERLETTLRAWLDDPGAVTRVAERLHVHPQTVRYRMGRLRELLGERLDDPDARFALALALRARAPHPSSGPSSEARSSAISVTAAPT